MKIGIDCRLWNETGVGRYIRALVGELQQIDQQNDYILFFKKNEFQNIKFFNPRWKKILADVTWHTWEEQIKMPYIFNTSHADLIHIPYFSVPLFINKSFIVTIHDLTISNFATGKATTRPLPIYLLKRFGYKFILKHAIYKSQKILTVSNFVKNQLVKEFHLNPNKVVVTYESGELESVKTNRNIEKIPDNFCLYVGNAHPHKNLEKLLQAFIIIRKSLPNIQLCLVGKDDFFYKRLKQFSKNLHLNMGINFINFVSNSELPDWYKQAKLLIFPSLSEGFGIPGLEAMNCGCPVIASDINVYKEIYGNAAEYFNPRSVTDIADKVIKLLQNQQLLSDLTIKGKIQAQKYSWRKTAIETLKAYENCLSI